MDTPNLAHSKPTATTDSRRHWLVETVGRGARVRVVADYYEITRGGVLEFIDAPYGELNGTRELVTAFGPGAWTRLYPPDDPRGADPVRETIARDCNGGENLNA